MPKISLWNKNKTLDYEYIDKHAADLIDLGGTCVYVHKYLGPKGGNSIKDVSDFLFLENRSRNYDDTLYELRGHYTPQDNNPILMQLQYEYDSDSISLHFHINETVKRLGRKLTAGDVLELPHLREYFTLDEDDLAFNKFFVVEDVTRAAKGFGPRWWPHLILVNASKISAAEEFEDIVGKKDVSENSESDLINIISSQEFDNKVSDEITKEAACNTEYDPTYYKGYHYYIYNDENGNPMVYWGTGDGAPPNGEPIRGEGTEFPDNMQDGEYFLRTDFSPPTLYKKSGCKYIRVEADLRQCWTAQNKLLDTFIDNNNVITHDDCTTEDSRQPLSKVIRPKDNNE